LQIVVTGAAGRLGRHVVARALRAGHEVVASDLPAALDGAAGGADAMRRQPADLTDLDEVRAVLAGADAVVHLGGLVHPNFPEPLVHRVNVEGTYHVLVAAEEHGLAGVCLASSINAIGGVYSVEPRYDHFPIDEEEHPSYAEDAYSLSKWIVEQQSAAFARRRPDAAFSALRLHGLRDDAASAQRNGADEGGRKDLWGWVSFDAAAAACLLAVLRPRPGHAVYHVVADRTTTATSSAELASRFYPDAQLRAPLEGSAGFYSTARITADLGWDPAVDHPEISDAERDRRPLPI
jgi:nucleoside-diphosphate-sugar epimerase